MPELPDVEMMRRYLAETSLHQRVHDVRILDDYVIKDVSSNEFRDRLRGIKFERVGRRGKFLEVYTDSKYDLAIHFGMTGYLRYIPSYASYQKYTRVVFTFFQNYDLRYVAKRKLGGLYLVPDGKFNSVRTIENMGPEPLDPKFNFQSLKNIAEGRSATLKALLLNQSFIAGIGNVYADEILFQTGVRPDRKISDLTETELLKLFRQIKRVLQTAIQHQTSFKGLEEDFLIPHRRIGEICPKCKSEIKNMKISNRTSYYCERCQR